MIGYPRKKIKIKYKIYHKDILQQKILKLKWTSNISNIELDFSINERTLSWSFSRICFIGEKIILPIKNRKFFFYIKEKKFKILKYLKNKRPLNFLLNNDRNLWLDRTVFDRETIEKYLSNIIREKKKI